MDRFYYNIPLTSSRNDVNGSRLLTVSSATFPSVVISCWCLLDAASSAVLPDSWSRNTPRERCRSAPKLHRLTLRR